MSAPRPPIPVGNRFSVPRRLRPFVALTVYLVIGLFALSTLLSVSIFPVITNDSLTYIDYADRLGTHGLVHAGYRQFGYPLFIALGGVGSSVLGVEPLLTVAILQRLLLATAVGYAIWLWRWWSAPIVVLALSAETIGYTNLLLTEGLSTPLALLLVCATAHFFKLRVRQSLNSSTRLAATLAVLVAALAFALLAIRFPFAVFGTCPLLVFAGVRDTAFRRRALIVFGAYLALSISLVGLVSSENSAENGKFSPSTRGARTEYWAAWSVVFKAGSGNAVDPRLSEYWDDGTPYGFIRHVENMDIPYAQQAVLYHRAIDDMLATAGIGVWESRAQSFLGALIGGRTDDMKRIVGMAMTADNASVDDAIHQNVYSQDLGLGAFADRYNDGEAPGFLLTKRFAPIVAPRIWPIVVRFVLPLSILGLALALMNRMARPIAVAGLASVLVYSMLVAFIRADNSRFLVTTTVFGVACAGAALALWTGGGLRRRSVLAGPVEGGLDMPMIVETGGSPARIPPSMPVPPPEQGALRE